MDDRDKTHRVAMPGDLVHMPESSPPVFYSQLAAPPSDKERLWHAGLAVMQGLLADQTLNMTPDELARTCFADAEAMVAELNRRTEGGE